MSTEIMLLVMAAVVLLILSVQCIALIWAAKHAGPGLLVIKSFETIFLKAAGIACLLLGILSPLAIRTVDSIVTAVIVSLIGIYFMLLAHVFKQAIAKNGIIVLEGFPRVILWQNIKRIKVHQQRIYLETPKGFVSIKVMNANMNIVETVIQEQMSKHHILLMA